MSQARGGYRGRVRRGVVLGLLALATAGMLARAVYLQVVHKDFLQERGAERHLRVVEVPAHRGMIVDRNGEPLAVSSPVDSVWANPPALLERRASLGDLARLLGWEVGELRSELEARADREFFYLRRHLQPAAARQVLALEIPGVHVQREYRRYYPAAEVTAHLLGFTDIDDRGQEGLELAFDGWLQGVPGAKRVIRDRLGRVIDDVESIRMPQPGRELVLSIDRRIQYLAYRALKAAVIQHRARAASAVVVDVRSGEVLALVNQPGANPNDRSGLDLDALRNRAVTDVYEPGSTLKPFTIAMALESGRYRPDTLIDTRPGHLRVGRHLVRDVHDYGRLDVTGVIAKSSNVGVTRIARSLPPETLWSLFSRLGFGEPSGLGLAGERPGALSHHSDWSAIGHANHAFGYGLSVTSLQLAQAYAVLAADGVRRPLSILRRDAGTPQEQRVLSARVAREVTAMLERAAGPRGTGSKAMVADYRVAGKTGTVHKVIDGRYAESRYRSLFAGMAPASRPRLVMVVMVDEPGGEEYFGGQVAAPVFGQVMAGALPILNVTPDQLEHLGLDMAAGHGARP